MTLHSKARALLVLLAASPVFAAHGEAYDALFTQIPLPSVHRGVDPSLDSILDAPSTERFSRVGVRSELIEHDTTNIPFNFPQGPSRIAERSSSEILDDGTLVWIGHWRSPTPDQRNDGPVNIDTLAGNEVILVRRDEKLMAHLRIDRESIMIQPLPSGGHALFHVNGDMLADWDRDDVTIVNDADILTPHDAINEAPSETTSPELSETRLLLVFDQSAAAIQPFAGMYAALRMAEFNQGLRNSGIDIQAKLGGFYVSEETAPVNAEEALSAILNNWNGVFGEVPAMRDATSSDIVVLFTGSSATSPCGAARAVGANAASEAFVIVNVQPNCARAYVFGHEIGHIYGANHNVIGPHPTIGYPHRPLYAYAWQRAGGATIVSHSAKAVNLYSGLNSVYGGVVLGHADTADNARFMRERAAIVAAFR